MQTLYMYMVHWHKIRTQHGCSFTWKKRKEKKGRTKKEEVIAINQSPCPTAMCEELSPKKTDGSSSGSSLISITSKPGFCTEVDEPVSLLRLRLAAGDGVLCDGRAFLRRLSKLSCTWQDDRLFSCFTGSVSCETPVPDWEESLLSPTRLAPWEWLSDFDFDVLGTSAGNEVIPRGSVSLLWVTWCDFRRFRLEASPAVFDETLGGGWEW